MTISPPQDKIRRYAPKGQGRIAEKGIESDCRGNAIKGVFRGNSVGEFLSRGSPFRGFGSAYIETTPSGYLLLEHAHSVGLGHDLKYAEYVFKGNILVRKIAH